MDWVICADDWGAHVSTTQHLASELARQDRVLWINSIGMRAPGLNARDVRRVAQKMRLRPTAAPRAETGGLEPGPVGVVHPHLLPWHLHRWSLVVSRLTFGRQVRAAFARFGIRRPMVLTINPMLVRHLYFEHAGLVYLRLDDYAQLPGTDARMVRVCEAEILTRADLLFYTARALAPRDPAQAARARYLPQGVDLEHFRSVPAAPPRGRVLGFFGLLAEWLDDELIEATARACPDWTLELVGPAQYVSPRWAALPNVKVLPPCPYAGLPAAISRWDAAWVPFRVNALTVGVNPLKLREYLAAGLPTLSTALPEALSLQPAVNIVRAAGDVRRALEEVLARDSAAARAARRAVVRDDGWDARARELRALVAAWAAARSAGEEASR